MKSKDKETRLGDKYISEGELKKAEECYLRSIAAEPSIYAYMGLSNVCSNSKRYGEAIENFKKATECDTDDAGEIIKAYRKLGYAYVFNGQADKALETFKACSLLHGTYMKQISEDLDRGGELISCILDSRL